MPTTPTSLVNRLIGAETWTDAVNFGTAAHTFGGAVAFTGTPVFGTSGIPLPGLTAPVAIGAATTTLTLTPSAHANRLVTIASTGGLAVTPPAATGTGNVYTFLVTTTISGGNFTFDAKAGNASDLVKGTALQFKSGTGATFYSAGTNTNLITLDGSTRGGIAGDVLELLDVATNLWIVFLWSQGTGTVATPFSNH